MGRLILIKHANPAIDVALRPADWPLSDAGRRRARVLAQRLPVPGAGPIYASAEPKAMGTAQVLADEWSLPVAADPRLREHERDPGPMLAREEFERRIRDMFARPAEVVFGRESAAAALRRFRGAAFELIAAAAGDVTLVTHGTVLTLFVADVTAIEPFPFWRSLTLPCAVTMTTRPFTVLGLTTIDERA